MYDKYIYTCYIKMTALSTCIFGLREIFRVYMVLHLLGFMCLQEIIRGYMVLHLLGFMCLHVPSCNNQSIYGTTLIQYTCIRVAIIVLVVCWLKCWPAIERLQVQAQLDTGLFLSPTSSTLKNEVFITASFGRGRKAVSPIEFVNSSFLLEPHLVKSLVERVVVQYHICSNYFMCFMTRPTMYCSIIVPYMF